MLTLKEAVLTIIGAAASWYFSYRYYKKQLRDHNLELSKRLRLKSARLECTGEAGRPPRSRVVIELFNDGINDLRFTDVCFVRRTADDRYVENRSFNVITNSDGQDVRGYKLEREAVVTLACDITIADGDVVHQMKALNENVQQLWNEGFEIEVWISPTYRFVISRSIFTQAENQQVWILLRHTSDDRTSLRLPR